MKVRMFTCICGARFSFMAQLRTGGICPGCGKSRIVGGWVGELVDPRAPPAA